MTVLRVPAGTRPTPQLIECNSNALIPYIPEHSPVDLLVLNMCYFLPIPIAECKVVFIPTEILSLFNSQYLKGSEFYCPTVTLLIRLPRTLVSKACVTTVTWRPLKFRLIVPHYLQNTRTWLKVFSTNGISTEEATWKLTLLKKFCQSKKFDWNRHFNGSSALCWVGWLKAGRGRLGLPHTQYWLFDIKTS